MMKKLLFSVAILAAAASCSQNEIVENKAASPIGFSVLNDNVTRAEIAGKANDAGDSYHVIAVSSADNASYYINAEMGTANDKTYMWPTDGTTTLDFYAIAPYSVGASTDLVFGQIGLNDYQIPGNVDITAAAPIEDQYRYDAETASNDGKVDFKFSHMLAKVMVQVKLSDELTKAGYVLVNKGTDEAPVYNYGGMIVNSFYGDLIASDANAAFSDVTTSHSGYSSGDFLTYYHDADNVFYVLPQTSTGCYVQGSKVAIRTNTADAAADDFFSGDLHWYDIKAGDIPSDKFEAGKAYMLTLTITSTSTDDPNDPEDPTKPTDPTKPDDPTTPGDPIFGGQIKFSASLVDWTEVSVGDLTQE